MKYRTLYNNLIENGYQDALDYIRGHKMQLYYADEVYIYIFDRIKDKYKAMIVAKKKELQRRKLRKRRKTTLN